MIITRRTRDNDSGMEWMGQGKSIASQGSSYFPKAITLMSQEIVTNWTGPINCVGSKCSHWNWVTMCVVRGSMLSDTLAPNFLTRETIKSVGIELNESLLDELGSSSARSPSKTKKWNRNGARNGLSESGRYNSSGKTCFSLKESKIHQSIMHSY